MLKLEKFTNNKTYMFPNGSIASPEEIEKQFPAVIMFPHVIEVNGDVCQAVMSLNALRSIHNIDSELNEVDAIAAIESKMNTPQEVIVSPEERLAAASEFQNILTLPDTAEINEIADDTIIRKNVTSGLWGMAHLNILVKKGLLTQEHANSINQEAKLK